MSNEELRTGGGRSQPSDSRTTVADRR